MSGCMQVTLYVCFCKTRKKLLATQKMTKQDRHGGHWYILTDLEYFKNHFVPMKHHGVDLIGKCCRNKVFSEIKLNPTQPLVSFCDFLCSVSS